MTVLQSLLLGAGGGAIVEILAVFQSIALWSSERKTPTGRVKTDLPGLREFLDLPATALILPSRAVLGAGAAALFVGTGQITGAVAAVAIGYAAPTVLGQLGQFPQVKALVVGGTPPHAAVAPGEAPGADSGTLVGTEGQEASGGR